MYESVEPFYLLSASVLKITHDFHNLAKKFPSEIVAAIILLRIVLRHLLLRNQEHWDHINTMEINFSRSTVPSWAAELLRSTEATRELCDVIWLPGFKNKN